MFSRQFVLLPVFFLFCIASLNAQNSEDSQKAKAILLKGKENLQKMKYKSFLINYEYTGKPESSVTIYNKFNPDGTTSQRYEYNSKTSSYRYLSITTKDGDFRIYGKTAVKTAYQRGRCEMSGQGEQATYSLSEGFHRDIPCDVVTKKIAPDETLYNNFVKSFAENQIKTSEEFRGLFEDYCPVTEVYYIGKYGKFIYKYEFYNIRGKKIVETNYGDVELNASLDDRLFDIAGNFNIIIANNLEEEIALTSFLTTLKHYDPRRSYLKKLSTASSLSLAEIKGRLTPWYFSTSFFPESDVANSDY